MIPDFDPGTGLESGSASRETSDSMSSPRSRPIAVVLVVFFLSGASALLYQIVWLKYLGLVFGNTVHAAATLIAVFLAGLGIGAFLFGRRLQMFPPLLVYALVEALVGAFGALSPRFFGLLDIAYIATFRWFDDAPALLAIARIVGASTFLLLPTILMGGTLPVLIRWWTRGSHGTGKAVSSLYAANTFGATAGVALAGFVLIPKVGLLATILVAVLLNFALASGAALLGWAGRKGEGVETGTGEEGAGDARRSLPVAAAAVLVASFLMGLTSIADEVFWSRIFVLHLGSSVYAYSLMLFSFLIGIASGSAIIERSIDRANLVRVLGALELGLALVLVAQVHYLGWFGHVLEAFAEVIRPEDYSGTVVVLAASVLSAILIPTAIMGATFPIAVKLFADAADRSESRSAGTIYFVNTIGSILGSLMAGFILIPVIGSQNGLFAMAGINLLIGLYFSFRAWNEAPRAFRRRLIAAAVVVFLAVTGMLLARPDQVLLSAGLFEAEGSSVLLFREDVTATVTLRELRGRGLSLELNGVNVAGTASDLIGTQKLQGHLPLLMHPDPKKVLHIGFGSGGTAYSVSLHPVEEIRIAEISPEVLESSDQYLRSVNHGVLEDPRVRVEINDGRNFVMATPEKFDVILSDSIHPRYAGNGSLYTLDYFQLCREKLEPDGVISMWLPTYSLTTRNYQMIVKAFQQVFPNTTIWYVPNDVNAFTIVIGRMEEGPIPMDRIRAGISEPVLQDLAEIGMGDPWALASSLMIDPRGAAEMTRDVPPHVDDIPAVEYESGRILDRNQSWLVNFVALIRNVTPIGRAFTGIDQEMDELKMAEQLRLGRLEKHLAHLKRALERDAMTSATDQ